MGRLTVRTIRDALIGLAAVNTIFTVLKDLITNLDGRKQTIKLFEIRCVWPMSEWNFATSNSNLGIAHHGTKDFISSEKRRSIWSKKVKETSSSASNAAISSTENSECTTLCSSKVIGRAGFEFRLMVTTMIYQKGFSILSQARVVLLRLWV